ncbi:uncharacterized protein IUM83_00271 [Phytophthora cinnamomi]|uniref:uncharacterized protein n=1 Tax=Phytophthora cinnamomi TaxID=4785 RepID=UPI0035593D80|nr:hypothetical protein IUM83_00271 [Phytophthora cinnamomi]
MGFSHSLEVLYALLRLYAGGAAASPAVSDLPYPHLQQRLQQTLRAVALTTLGAVVFPLLLLLSLPLLSPLQFPGFTAFLLVVGVLWAAAVAHLTLRFALLPTPRRAAAEPVASTRGGLQTAVCAAVDAVTRAREQPQLPVLLLLCVLHSYVWKLALYYGMASSAQVAADFGSFAVAGGLVAFASFVAVETSLAQDPFVLDPRAAFVRAMQRDVVRAARRGVLVYVAGRALSWLFGSGDEVKMQETESGFFALHASRVTFQITSSVLENLAILSAASVFRILLFRASYQVLGGAFGDSNNLWDSLAVVKPKEGNVTTALFATEVAANPQISTPLNEQYLQGLHKRMSAAVRQISEKKTPKAPADAEDVETLDSLFKFENLLTGCKFDAAARESLFTSRGRWNALFNSTTAVVDAFTLMVQLLNTLTERKGSAGDNSSTEDKQGYVQHTVPAVLSSLMECRNALEAYMETCLKESSTNDVYVQEATALAKGIDSGIYRITEVFQGELSLFEFPPGVKTALRAYASFAT